MLTEAGLPAPAFGTATTLDQAKEVADRIGYPVLVRPSYVLGGRGMEIVYDEASLRDYISRATELTPDHPVLVDRFLEDAVEIDVDALCDGTEVYPRRDLWSTSRRPGSTRRLSVRPPAGHPGPVRPRGGAQGHRGACARHRRAP